MTLDRHHAVEAGIAGLVDLAHAPGAEGRFDEIRTELCTWLKRHAFSSGSLLKRQLAEVRARSSYLDWPRRGTTARARTTGSH